MNVMVFGVAVILAGLYLFRAKQNNKLTRFRAILVTFVVWAVFIAGDILLCGLDVGKILSFSGLALISVVLITAVSSEMRAAFNLPERKMESITVAYSNETERWD